MKIQELKLARLNCLEFLSFHTTEEYCTILQNFFLCRYHMIVLRSEKSQEVYRVIPLKKCTAEDEDRFFITQSQHSSPYRGWVNFSKLIPKSIHIHIIYYILPPVKYIILPLGLRLRYCDSRQSVAES